MYRGEHGAVVDVLQGEAEAVTEDGCDATAVETEPDAKRAYERRQGDQLSRQAGISEWGD